MNIGVIKVDMKLANIYSPISKVLRTELTHSFCFMVSLNKQLYCTESLRPAGYPVTCTRQQPLCS